MVYLINFSVMITKGYCKNNVYKFNMGDLSTSIPVEKSVVDSFYIEKHTEKDGQESVSYHDPIRMLFNQERLNQLGSAAVQRWLDTLKQAKSSPINSLRENCSDEMLMELIKSRHIQSMSELQAYAEYHKNNLDEFKSSVQKLIAEQQAAKAAEKAATGNESVEKIE